jgi:hypothetical protein
MMGEEYYCVLKLVSGEEVFSLISVDENDGDPIIVMQNPVIMKMIQNNMGSCVKIKPWMEIPNEDIFVIKFDKIITMTEVSDNSIISVYEKYIRSEGEGTIGLDTPDKDGKVRISNQMGYVSSVDDARKKLEELYKGIKES